MQDLDGEDRELLRKQIGWKWHVITLKEAIEYVDYELCTDRFTRDPLPRMRGVCQYGQSLL